MKRLRWIPAALVAALLMGTGGSAAWAYLHRSYQGIVDYRRVALTNGSPYAPFGTSAVIQEWSDVQHRRDRTIIDGVAHSIEWVVRDGRIYQSSGRTGVVAIDPATEQWIQWLFQQGCGGASTGNAGNGNSRVVHLDTGSGYLSTLICVRHQRLAPGTLPAGFFDPPHGHTSPWDQALDWMHQHIGLG